MYGNLEEECGLVWYVMCIYEWVMCVVLDEDRVDMFNFYIIKLVFNFGFLFMCFIYECVIVIFFDNEVKDMCFKFVDMEKCFGEIDWVRVIYGYGF